MPIPIPGSGTMEGVPEGFQPMPAGVYPAEVANLEEVVTGPDSQKVPPGTPMLKWEFTITDEEYAGQKAWTNNVMTEKALPIYRALLKGIGFDDSEIDAMSDTVDRDEVVGRQCRVVLKVGVNPKTKQRNNSVTAVLPYEEGSDSELPE